ncbi:MAG: hypothetical protein V4671_19365 [Armatimonadota bacterium]
MAETETVPLKALVVTLIDSMPQTWGCMNLYQVGSWRVRVYIDDPVFKGGEYMADVKDRTGKTIPGTEGFGGTQDEAVTECLTKWARMTKPSGSFSIPVETEGETK